MTIDKAIELTHNLLVEPRCRWKPDNYNAIKLTLEASKRFKALREVIRVPYTELLPGEDPIIDTHRSLHHIKEVLESPPGREPRH